MKRYLLAFIMLLAVASTVFASVPTTADENNPRTNPDANACYIGGSLYGKCETTDVDMDQKVTVEEIKYMYDAGWFVIRFEKGTILRSQVPRMYRWLLAPEPVTYPSNPASVPAAPATTCTLTISSGAPILAGQTISAPMAVITGGSDPNATFGASPFGFDWSGTTLWLFSGSTGVGTFSSGTYSTFVASTTCPPAVPPAP